MKELYKWKYGLASRTPIATARIVSMYTTAVNGLLTAVLLAYTGFLVLISGVLAPIAILLHQTGRLFAILRRSNALQSISRPLKSFLDTRVLRVSNRGADKSPR